MSQSSQSIHAALTRFFYATGIHYEQRGYKPEQAHVKMLHNLYETADDFIKQHHSEKLFLLSLNHVELSIETTGKKLTEALTEDKTLERERNNLKALIELDKAIKSFYESFQRSDGLEQDQNK